MTNKTFEEILTEISNMSCCWVFSKVDSFTLKFSERKSTQVLQVHETFQRTERGLLLSLSAWEAASKRITVHKFYMSILVNYSLCIDTLDWNFLYKRSTLWKVQNGNLVYKAWRKSCEQLHKGGTVNCIQPEGSF